MAYYDVSGMTLGEIQGLYPNADLTTLASMQWLGGGGSMYIDENGQYVPPLLVTNPDQYYAETAASRAGWDNMYINSDLYNPNGENTQTIQTNANNLYSGVPDQYQNTYNTNYTTGYNNYGDQSGNTGTGTGTGTGPGGTGLSVYNTNNNQVNERPELTNATVVGATNGQWRESAPGVNTATFGANPVRRESGSGGPAGVLPTNQGGGTSTSDYNDTFMNRAMNAWDV